MMPVACLGAGRMGRGIAVVFAFAGHPVDIIDFKPRSPAAFDALAAEARAELASTLGMLARIGLMQDGDVPDIVARITVVPEAGAAGALARAGVVFEGFPEILSLKREALARASRLTGPDAIIASTTSTILVDDLADAVERPGRFLNAHWLNPAFLMPLVELSPGQATSSATTQALKALLEAMGKVPVVCKASPGYIVPRIQALAMNEAALMVQEGVASAEDIDKAVRYGFGFRFAVLGLLEFIDWGGGDTLYHACRYLTDALGDARYASPEIVERNMRDGRIGMKSREGFLDYRTLDLQAHQEARLSEFAAALRRMGLARRHSARKRLQGPLDRSLFKALSNWASSRPAGPGSPINGEPNGGTLIRA